MDIDILLNRNRHRSSEGSILHRLDEVDRHAIEKGVLEPRHLARQYTMMSFREKYGVRV